MRARCNNPRHPFYSSYGGKGVRVCKRWDNFQSFVEDVGERPSDYTLDRIDNNGDYEPQNVRWASIHQQLHNRSCTVYSTALHSYVKRLHREGWNVRQLVDYLGVSRAHIYRWLKREP